VSGENAEFFFDFHALTSRLSGPSRANKYEYLKTKREFGNVAPRRPIPTEYSLVITAVYVFNVYYVTVFETYFFFLTTTIVVGIPKPATEHNSINIVPNSIIIPIDRENGKPDDFG